MKKEPSLARRQIIQYGQERSATALQHQTLCALTAVVANPKAKVQCVNFHTMYADQDFNYNCRLNKQHSAAEGEGGTGTGTGGGPGGSQEIQCDEVGGSNPGGDDYYIVARTRELLPQSPETQLEKSYRGETATSLSRAAVLSDAAVSDEDITSADDVAEEEQRRRTRVSTWLFYSAKTEQDWRSNSDVGSIIGRVAGAGYVDHASCTTLDDILEEGPGGLVEKYRRGFANAGATRESADKVREYVELWDKLRMCCGKHMSRHHRMTLRGRKGELTGAERETERQMCGSLNLGHTERKLIKTEVFRRFSEDIPVLARVSHQDGVLNGTYCEQFNARIEESAVKDDDK